MLSHKEVVKVRLENHFPASPYNPIVSPILKLWYTTHTSATKVLRLWTEIKKIMSIQYLNVNDEQFYIFPRIIYELHSKKKKTMMVTNIWSQ